MQSKVKFSLVLTFALMGFAFMATAQEEGQPSPEMRELNQHPELNLNDDKTLIMESESKTVRLPSNQNTREGNTGNPAALKAKSENASKPAGEKPGDPLSFNFLYFIIQKFKISDIVD